MKITGFLIVLVTSTIGAAALPSGAVAAACAHAHDLPTRATVTVAARSVLCLVNAQRRHHGLHALRANARLRRTALTHARRMVHDRHFDHVWVDGTTFEQRMKRSSYTRGVRRWFAAENIGWGVAEAATPEAMVKAWMLSPEHRRNILTSRFRDAGLAVVADAPAHVAADVHAATYTTDFGKVIRKR